VRARGRAKPLAAAASAALAIFLLQASVDWTFSFPALVAAVLLVLGASAGPSRSRPTGVVAAAGAIGVAAVLLLMLAGPLFSARALAQSMAAADDPPRAWQLASRARTFDRWDGDVISWQGQVAESAGHFLLAARLYNRAVGLTQQPWVDQFARARVLRRAGLVKASREACRAAHSENPLEWRLQVGPCAHAAQ
jgi:hypothetical protein